MRGRPIPPVNALVQRVRALTERYAEVSSVFPDGKPELDMYRRNGVTIINTAPNRLRLRVYNGGYIQDVSVRTTMNTSRPVEEQLREDLKRNDIVVDPKAIHDRVRAKA